MKWSYMDSNNGMILQAPMHPLTQKVLLTILKAYILRLLHIISSFYSIYILQYLHISLIIYIFVIQKSLQ